MNRKADPVTIEVVRNLLMSIAEETNTVIIKSAYSTNIKERRDNTTAIMDPAGNVVVQVESSIPMLLAALLFAARGVVAEYKPEDIHPGDMFIVNDPYHGGGNHLPDITVVGPVFVGQKLWETEPISRTMQCLDFPVILIPFAATFPTNS